MVANSVCHPTSAALIISRQRGRSIYPDRGRADCERTKTIIEIEKSVQSNRQRLYLIVGGRVGLVAATGRDSEGVKSDRRWTAMGGNRGRGSGTLGILPFMAKWTLGILDGRGGV